MYPSRLASTNISKDFVCITHDLQHNTMELFLIEKITNNKCNILVWKVCQKNVNSIYSSINVRYTYNIFKTNDDVLQALT
jgi:hypothetical protein